MSPLTAVAAVSAVWVVSELALAGTRRARAGSERRDAGSFWVVNAAIYASLGGGVWVGLQPVGHVHGPEVALGWAGAAMMLAGISLRRYAIHSLKQFFTVTVALHPQHRIVRDGPYRLLRHPSYTGALVGFVGLGVAFSNWISVLAVVLPVAAAILYRIAVEEHALVDRFGAEYRAYQRETWRLIPHVW